MQTITTIGLDIAKSVFQVHGVDAEGNVTLRRQLKRRYVLAFFQKLPPCLVGIKGYGRAAARRPFCLHLADHAAVHESACGP
jgi:transposase